MEENKNIEQPKALASLKTKQAIQFPNTTFCREYANDLDNHFLGKENETIITFAFQNLKTSF